MANEEALTQARQEFDAKVEDSTKAELAGIKWAINWLARSRAAGYRRLLTEKHNGVFTHPKIR
jgi:hypothetical protein